MTSCSVSNSFLQRVLKRAVRGPAARPPRVAVLLQSALSNVHRALSIRALHVQEAGALEHDGKKLPAPVAMPWCALQHVFAF